MVDRVGQQLGNYHLILFLGEGGFAEVYLGEHIHLGTQAAIKVLHTQLTSDDVDTFRTEARTIARLIHPHIVRILEFGLEGKTPFLVMDYAPHGSLRQRHRKGVALPLPLIVAYVKQVVDALQYAHDEKLIHRDIKPENMLLGRRNEILLSDFGIALVAQSSRYQSAQEMAGTMAYMAPEQIQGKPRPASDQYSLGIVVYEWLSGDRPFRGSLTELVGQHLSVPPPSLQEKVSTILPEVDRVVLTALAKDPKQRFASVQAFATALEQASESVQSYPSVSSNVDSSLDQPPQHKSKAPSARQPSPPTDTIAAISLGQVTQAADGVASPSQSLEPTDTVIPASQSSQLADAITPSSTSSVSPPSVRNTELSDGPQLLLPSQRRISRRAIMIGLIGLTGVSVAGTGIAWLARSQRSQVFSPSPRLTPTATPTPTPGVVKIPSAGLKVPGLLQWGATSTFGAPFVFPDPTNQNKLVGFEVEIADAIAKLMDVTSKQIEKDYGQLESALLSNQFDMIMNGWKKTSDREKTELFSDPYYRYGQQIVVRRDDSRFTNMTETSDVQLSILDGLTVGTGTGYEAQFILATDPKINTKLYDGGFPFDDLAQKKLDAVLIDLFIVTYYALGIGPGSTNKPILKAIGKPLSPDVFVVGFNKSNPNAQTLLGEINQAFAELKHDGTLKRIYQKWGLWNDEQTVIGLT